MIGVVAVKTLSTPANTESVGARSCIDPRGRALRSRSFTIVLAASRHRVVIDPGLGGRPSKECRASPFVDSIVEPQPTLKRRYLSKRPIVGTVVALHPARRRGELPTLLWPVRPFGFEANQTSFDITVDRRIVALQDPLLPVGHDHAE